jgi:hypothetical protein
MHSPLSPQLAAAAATAPAGPLQYQASLGTAAGGIAGNTCDAVTQLLTATPQPGSGTTGIQQQQQQPPCVACGAGSSPFSVMLQEPFPEGSPRKGPLASHKSCSSGLSQVREEEEQTQQQQQQESAGGKSALSSSPSGRPSVFHTAVAAAAAASGASSSSNAVRAMAAAGGLGGLCVTTSLPAAFTAGSVHSAGSIPDMFSLPSLSYGLATLPPPELLAAAASRSLAGAGSGAVPPPWDCGLGLAHSASLGMAQGAQGLGSIGHQGSGGSGAGGSLSPTGSLRGSAGGCRGVVVGATGGLMAPFSPMPRARSSSLPGCFSMGSGSVGAIFPECLTASVVTDEEQQLPMRLSLPPNLLQQLQQGQQQQGVQQLLQGQQVDLQSYPAAAAAAAAAEPAVAAVESAVAAPAAGSGATAMPAGAASSVAATDVQQVRKPLVHPAFARPAGNAAPAGSSTSAEASRTAATACSSSSSSSASSTPDVPPKQHQALLGEFEEQHPQQQQRVGPATGTPRSAGGAAAAAAAEHVNHSSSSPLHGILLNGPHSRPRSPAPGVSPSSSMKSVRFSFENLDQDGLQHALLSSSVNGSSSEPGSKLVSPRGGKDRQELHDQWRMQHGGSGTHTHTGRDQQQQDAANGVTAGWIGAAGSYDGHGSRSRGSAGQSPRHPLMSGGSSSSRLSAGGIARSPPCGSDDEEYYQIRAGHVSRSEGGASGRSSRARQMMLQQAKAAAAARAAAMVVNLPLPKGSPVHPIFGRAAPVAAAGQGAQGGAGVQG